MATTTVASRPSTSPPTVGSRPSSFKALTGMVHLTLALLLVQAIFAGVFISDTYAKKGGGDGWVSAHGVVADAIWVVALAGTVYAVAKLRRSAPLLALLSFAYFALALVETGIGHLISEASLLGVSGNRNGLIALHIPLAIVLFALGGFIAVRSSRTARIDLRQA